jgi:ABC-type branched-subunit amino acid transport system substrate-binding protein
LHPQAIGLICVTSPFGQANCDQDEAVIKQAGIRIVNRVSAQPTSTNETTQAQAMRGADLVLDEGFPGPIVLDIKAMAAAGIDVPVSAGASVVYSTTGLSQAELSRLYGFADCLPQDFTTPPGSTVESDFVAMFHSAMSGYGAHYYDAVMMLAKAAEAAGSPDPTKIATELRTMAYQGICGPLHADNVQAMSHSIVVIQAQPDGKDFSVLNQVSI